MSHAHNYKRVTPVIVVTRNMTWSGVECVWNAHSSLCPSVSSHRTDVRPDVLTWLGPALVIAMGTGARELSPSGSDRVSH